MSSKPHRQYAYLGKFDWSRTFKLLFVMRFKSKLSSLRSVASIRFEYLIQKCCFTHWNEAATCIHNGIIAECRFSCIVRNKDSHRDGSEEDGSLLLFFPHMPGDTMSKIYFACSNCQDNLVQNKYPKITTMIHDYYIISVKSYINLSTLRSLLICIGLSTA